MNAPNFKRLFVSTALIVVSTLLAFFIVVGLDRVVGSQIKDSRLAAGLIFPPQVELAVWTYEFSYTIRTNSIGLRDDPYDPHARPRIVVAAIGDSYTFGQGVALEDTWVQRVERSLRAKGLDVEILNFGQPGSSPQFYARLAEETMSLVKPDLVLVDLLQSDDLQQINLDQTAGEETLRRDPWIRTQLRAWFPSLTDLAYREQARYLTEREHRSNGNWSLLQSRWKDDFQKMFIMLDATDEGARLTYLSLPTAVQDAFRNGELHPIVARRCSTAFRLEMEKSLDLPLDAPELQPQIAVAAQCFTRIDAAIKPWGGQTLVLSLPSMANNDPYGSKDWYRIFGVQVPRGFNDTRADDAIHLAAKTARLPSHDVTAAFREAARKEPLFYPLDTHMNARGNEVYADLIAPVIEKYVREIADR